MSFWDRKIDIIFLSHPQPDYITGLISVLKRYQVIHYFTDFGENPTNLEKMEKTLLAEKNLTAKPLFNGDLVAIKDQTTFQTLWPEPNVFKIASESKSLDENSISLIEVLKYKNFTAYFSEDAEELAADHFLNKIPKLSFLKIPYYGSKDGISQQFIFQTKPELAVISVGKNNKYGLLAKQTTDLLKSDNIKTLRTDQCGEVEVVTDGEGALAVFSGGR